MVGRLVLGLVLSALVGCVFLALDRPVRNVEVVGALLPAEAQEVRQRLTEFQPKRLLSTNLGALREHLLGLSWPELVQIRRVWPDTLQIRVTRKLVVAKWGAEGYLTAVGDLISSFDPTGGAPLLDCEVSSPQKALEVYQYLQDIAAEGDLEIRSLAENALGEWRLELANGVRANLGADDLRSRMGRFMHVHRHLAELSAQPVRYLDLRYPNGAAVRFDEPQMLANR